MNDTKTPPSTIQRILGFFRFWLNVRANVTVVLANQGNMARALQTSAAVINQLNARVTWYEHRIPTIAKEFAAFKYQEKKLGESIEAQENYAEREKRRAASAPAETSSRPQLEVVSR